MMGTTGVLTVHHAAPPRRPRALHRHDAERARRPLLRRRRRRAGRQVDRARAGGGVRRRRRRWRAPRSTSCRRRRRPRRPGSSGVLFLPWVFGSVSPALDRRHRGALLGLSLSTSSGDVARAMLEGISMQMRWLADEVEQAIGVEFGVDPLRRRRRPVRPVGVDHGRRRRATDRPGRQPAPRQRPRRRLHGVRRHRPTGARRARGARARQGDVRTRRRRPPSSTPNGSASFATCTVSSPNPSHDSPTEHPGGRHDLLSLRRPLRRRSRAAVGGPPARCDPEGAARDGRARGRQVGGRQGVRLVLLRRPRALRRSWARRTRCTAT